MYQSLQGNLGLGKAIEYFSSHKIPISIPLNDTQKYDLVADFNGSLQKIQVKTSRSLQKNGSYQVHLRNTGGNKGGKCRQVHFDSSTCDYVFVYTMDGKMYLIPTSILKDIKNSIWVGVKYTEYEVYSNTFTEFINSQQ